MCVRCAAGLIRTYFHSFPSSKAKRGCRIRKAADASEIASSLASVFASRYMCTIAGGSIAFYRSPLSYRIIVWHTVAISFYRVLSSPRDSSRNRKQWRIACDPLSLSLSLQRSKSRTNLRRKQGEISHERRENSLNCLAKRYQVSRDRRESRNRGKSESVNEKNPFSIIPLATVSWNAPSKSVFAETVFFLRERERHLEICYRFIKLREKNTGSRRDRLRPEFNPGPLWLLSDCPNRDELHKQDSHSRARSLVVLCVYLTKMPSMLFGRLQI